MPFAYSVQQPVTNNPSLDRFCRETAIAIRYLLTPGAATITAWKAPVRVATTANIQPFGSQTIDGVVVHPGDRVLLKDQTYGQYNGIWVVGLQNWNRADDANSSANILPGMCVAVTSGATSGDKIYILATDAPITMDPATPGGATPLTFVELTGSAGSSGFTTKYEVDFTALATQTLLTGGDGTKTLSDGSVWTARNTSFASTFGVTNGTGLVITKSSSSNHFMYLLAKLNELPATGVDPWSDDIEIWFRATVSGGFTTANSGCFFIAEMRDCTDTDPTHANFNVQRSALEVMSSTTTTPNKSTYSEQNNTTQTNHNTTAVDSPIHDVFMIRSRGPAMRDLYTGTYSAGWPSSASLVHEATLYYINDATLGNASTYTLAPMQGLNLGLAIILGSTGTATPSVTVTNLRVRSK